MEGCCGGREKGVERGEGGWSGGEGGWGEDVRGYKPFTSPHRCCTLMSSFDDNQQ